MWFQSNILKFWYVIDLSALNKSLYGCNHGFRVPFHVLLDFVSTTAEKSNPLTYLYGRGLVFSAAGSQKSSICALSVKTLKCWKWDYCGIRSSVRVVSGILKKITNIYNTNTMRVRPSEHKQLLWHISQLPIQQDNYIWTVFQRRTITASIRSYTASNSNTYHTEE